MAWNIKFNKSADKELDKLQPQTAKRILDFLFKRISKLSDPRDIWEALKRQKIIHLWKYRVGDYRIIADIRNKDLIIMIIKIGHRKEVYKN